MDTQYKKGGIFYGWIIAILGMLVMATASGVTSSCFSQFIKPVCADLGFSRQAMSTNQTLMMAGSIFFSFFWGKIANRIPVKKAMVLATIVCFIVYFSFSLVSSIWLFYIFSLIISICNSLLSTLPFSMILSNWFYDKKGTAMGLCFMGSGFGGMVLNPLLGKWLTLYSWRTCYQILAVIMVVIAVPCVLLIRIRPEDKGLLPLGYEKGRQEKKIVGGDGVTLAEAKKMPKFWLLALCCAFITMSLASIGSCLSPHFTDNGYSSTFAANALAVGMGVTALGKFCLGKAFDKFGARKAAAGSLLFSLVGIAGMILCKTPFGIYMAVIGLACNGYGMVANPNIIQAVFGKKDQSAILGFLSAFNSIGGSLSPIINGAVFDRTGSYTPAFFIWFCLVTFVIITFITVIPSEKKTKA